MKQLAQMRAQAAIELLDHLIRKEIDEAEDKYKHIASLDIDKVNEVLVVAGAAPVKIDGKKELEVIDCDNG